MTFKFSWRDFWKCLNIKFRENPSSGSSDKYTEGWRDGQTWRNVWSLPAILLARLKLGIWISAMHELRSLLWEESKHWVDVQILHFCSQIHGKKCVVCGTSNFCWYSQELYILNAFFRNAFRARIVIIHFYLIL